MIHEDGVSIAISGTTPLANSFQTAEPSHPTHFTQRP